MASKYWIKLYHEILDDPKVGQLRLTLRWRFIECLLVAGEREDDGYLPSSQEMAWRVRADTEQLDTDLRELADAGLLSKVDSRWHVTNFAKRQSALTDTERWRRWRDRQRKQEYHEEQTSFKRPSNESANDSFDRIDIDKKRIDIDVEPSPNGETYPRYEHPPEDTPAADYYERRRELVSAISSVVKTVCAPGKTEQDFNNIASALLKQGATIEQVEAFGPWWKINGHYKGKPALTSFIQEFNNMGAVEQRKEAGYDAIKVETASIT